VPRVNVPLSVSTAPPMMSGLRSENAAEPITHAAPRARLRL
jgi:hypothetical protein